MGKRKLTPDIEGLISEIGDALSENDLHIQNIDDSIRLRNEMFGNIDMDGDGDGFIGGRSVLTEQTIGNLNNGAIANKNAAIKNKISLLTLYKASVEMATKIAVPEEESVENLELREMDMQQIRQLAKELKDKK